MTQVFRDCCREAYRRNGLPGLLGLWLITLGDTASSALAERIAEIIKRRGVTMAESSEARVNRRGELFGEDFKAALAEIADDNEPDYKGRAREAQDEDQAKEVRLADEPPVVRIAHTIIAQAIADGASEIRVEPAADSVRVHFRIEGAIHHVMTLPKRVQRKLVARYKHMADMDVQERGVPQDGRIGISHRGQDHDLQVHVEPMEEGERVAMRIKTQP